jgi:hypothetical protein
LPPSALSLRTEQISFEYHANGELRRQYQEFTEKITYGEAAAGERQRTDQEAAATQAAEARRRRTAADAEDLRKALDDRFRINSEYEDRVRRLREAEAAGGITGADRTRLETLALRRIEGTTRRVASIPRPDHRAEREINDRGGLGNSDSPIGGFSA